MHYGHTIDPERGFIYQELDGSFSAEQLIACTRRLWADPLYSKLFRGITNVSGVTFSPGLDDLQGLIAFLKTKPDTSQARWAVITTTPLVTAAAMVYQRRMTSQHPFAVFSTWEAACEFLQLDLPARPDVTFFPDIVAELPNCEA